MYRIKTAKYKMSLIILIVVFGILPVYASTGSSKEYLIDEYGAFDETEYQEVKVLIEQYSERDNVDYVVIFKSDFIRSEDTVYKNYVISLRKEVPYGRGNNDSSSFLIVDMDNRKMYVHGFGTFEFIYNSESAIDDVVGKAAEGYKESGYKKLVENYLEIASEKYYLQIKTDDYKEQSTGTSGEVRRESSGKLFVSNLFSLKVLGGAFVGALVVTLVVWGSHNYKKKADASNFEVEGSYNMPIAEDFFSHNHVTSRVIEKSSSSNSSGGGGSSGSSGGSGGSRSF